MKIVYVAGRFRGKTAWEVAQNFRQAEEVGFAVAEAGAMPLIPHANTAHFDGTKDAAFWLDGTMELLRRCDAVVTVPNWSSSEGATAEVSEAARLHIPVFHGVPGLKNWMGSQEATASNRPWTERVVIELAARMSEGAAMAKELDSVQEQLAEEKKYSDALWACVSSWRTDAEITLAKMDRLRPNGRPRRRRKADPATCTHPDVDIGGNCCSCGDHVRLGIPVEFARFNADMDRAAKAGRLPDVRLGSRWDIQRRYADGDWKTLKTITIERFEGSRWATTDSGSVEIDGRFSEAGIEWAGGWIRYVPATAQADKPKADGES